VYGREEKKERERKKETKRTPLLIDVVRSIFTEGRNRGEEKRKRAEGNERYIIYGGQSALRITQIRFYLRVGTYVQYIHRSPRPAILCSVGPGRLHRDDDEDSWARAAREHGRLTSAWSSVPVSLRWVRRTRGTVEGGGG